MAKKKKRVAPGLWRKRGEGEEDMSVASFSAQMNCKETGGDTLLPICILAQSGVLPLANNELLDGLWDISSRTRDWTWALRQWKCGVLTTRLPGDSQPTMNFNKLQNADNSMSEKSYPINSLFPNYYIPQTHTKFLRSTYIFYLSNFKHNVASTIRCQLLTLPLPQSWQPTDSQTLPNAPVGGGGGKNHCL